MFENVHSIGGSTFDLFEHSFDISDLAFMEMIACIMDTEDSLRTQMNGIRSTNAEKHKWAEEVEKLNRALKESGATRDRDWVDDGEGALKNYREELHSEMVEEFGRGTVESCLQQLSELSDSQLKDLYNTIKNDGSAKIPGTEFIVGDIKLAKLELFKRGLIQKGDLTSRIEELQNRIEELGSSSQLALIDLNRLMNQYQQRVQLVSMMESKDHQTVMKLIDNIR